MDTKIGRVCSRPALGQRRREIVAARQGRFSALLLRPGVQARGRAEVPTDEKGLAPRDPRIFDPDAKNEDEDGERLGGGSRPVPTEELKLERALDLGPDWSGGWKPAGPAPRGGVSASAVEVPGVALRIAELERILGSVARRVAWGGDGKRGSARIELDLANLAGGILVVHADQQGVDVELYLPPGESAGPWSDRIRQRLEARGFAVRRLEIQ